MTSRGKIDLNYWAELIKQRRLSNDEFEQLKELKVKQQNSHEFSDAYDDDCDHCIKQQLLLSQMSFSVVSFEFPPPKQELDKKGTLD